jgi:TonB family protein
MEVFAFYLLKSVTWLSGFALVYLVFLRNERYFTLNRFYLLSGVLSSFLLPLLTIRYSVALPVPELAGTEEAVAGSIESMTGAFTINTRSLLILLYLSGIIFIGFMMIRQGRAVIRTVANAGIVKSSPVKLIRTSDYTGSFSFFSFVFVNPSVTDIEMKEIVNHEMVHISQKHWVDLVLAGMLCILQWFNPLVWIYARIIRQNHEYIADEVALQRSADPAVYRATLLNQIAGSQVVILANSFTYSLNKKRFEMMKNIITSPYRKMKILLILPVFAIVLYAFAKPDYRYDTGNITGKDQPSVIQERTVKGTVVQSENGKPLEKATIVITGTTTGTLTDASGRFSLGNIPEGGVLAVSYVGYKSIVIKPVFSSEMTIRMNLDTINAEHFMNPTAPPPPPPPPPPSPPSTSEDLIIRNANKIDGPPPLIVVDGLITDINVNELDPATIQMVQVYKNETAVGLYGEKGRDGVIVITTKKHYQEMGGTGKTDPEKPETIEAGKDIFVVVEELPQFPGGNAEMTMWINDNMKYPEEAVNKKITGKVYVTFLISSSGKIINVEVREPVHPLLDAEAKRVISNMPDWKPGTQAGKPVVVRYTVPVEFKLN